MSDNINNPRHSQDRSLGRTPVPANEPKGKEKSEDSLTDASPDDSRADEKVIVNEQREHKTVNAPSQTAANANEGISKDEETIDD